jgi:hypothetical protein
MAHPNCPIGIFKFIGVYFSVGSWQTTALFFIEIKRLNFSKINKEYLGNVKKFSKSSFSKNIPLNNYGISSM